MVEQPLRTAHGRLRAASRHPVGRQQRAAARTTGGIEQRVTLAQIRHYAGAQQRSERRRDGVLVTLVGAHVLRQRPCPCGRPTGRAQEVIDGRELRPHTRGFPARRLRALLCLTPLAPSLLSRPLSGVERGTPRFDHARQLGNTRLGARLLRAQPLQLRLETRRALLLERRELGLDLGDAVGSRFSGGGRSMRALRLFDQRQLAPAPLGVLTRALTRVPRPLQTQRDPLGG